MLRILPQFRPPFAWFCLVCTALVVQTARAQVVISEVFWMGSDLSTADEWLELAGTGSGTDISGWYVTSMNSKGEEVEIFRFPAGAVIGSGQYMVIANNPASESRLLQEPWFTSKSLSLPNTKLLLRLYNQSGSLMDTVDDGIGEPFAGLNVSGGLKASMERLVLTALGNLKENWKTAEASLGFDEGTNARGTPGYARGSGVSSSSMASSGSLASFSSVSSMNSSSASGEILQSSSSAEFSSSPISSENSESSSSDSSESSNPNPNPPLIFITEVLANPKGVDSNEWIEIANFGTGTVLIEGWKLEVQTASSPRRFVIPAGSGSMLGPFEHRSYRGSGTRLPLRNAGDTVRLWSGNLLIDELSYPEAMEEVSFGRDQLDRTLLKNFCVPTEGTPNVEYLLDPMIVIQSGQTVGEEKVTLNVEADTASGSLASATCSWTYSDGFTSVSCNPPPHTFRDVGQHFIKLAVSTYCGITVERILPLEVLGKASSPKKVTVLPKDPSETLTCKVLSLAGPTITEFLPDPSGEEADNEWVEITNQAAESVSLCGWQLDDGEEGSKPFLLDPYSMAPGDRIVVRRPESKIALNNDRDEVRLWRPSNTSASLERVIAQAIPYSKPLEDESIALRDDGNFVATPYATPGAPNRFRTAERLYPHDKAVIYAALPNPVGSDEAGEWIEVANVTDAPLRLDGWLLDNKAGASKPFVLDGIELGPRAMQRFSIAQTAINLTNTADVARLLDPDGYVASIIGWTEAVEGRIYRPVAISLDRITATVVHVIDGDTLDISLDNPDDPHVPSSLQRRWLSAFENGKPIRVRMLGVDTPETVHPLKAVERFGLEASNFSKALLEGKKVELEFDSEMWDKYERLLAYVYLEGSKDSVQSQLLRSGLAYAYLRFPFMRQEEYSAYEAEAKAGKLGLWSDVDAAEFVDQIKEGISEEAILENKGLSIKVDHESGIVASGTVIYFEPSLTSDLYLSVNSGAYTSFSGSTVITGDVTLRAYAERIQESGSGSIRSDVVEAWFILERDSYEEGIEISEVFPAPLTASGSEWIELYNPMDHRISLVGWQLDDEEEGSKPWSIPPDVVIESESYFVVHDDWTKLALNNDGDTVRLITPDGKISRVLEYGKMKKGQSVILSGVKGCVTDLPTPGSENECIQFIPLKEAPDLDHDFLPDDREEYLYKTDFLSADSDGDQWLDGFEIQQGTDPLSKNSDDRSMQIAYASFVVDQVKPKWKLYKTKGLVMKGDNFPLRSLQAVVAGVSYTVEMVKGEDWQLAINEPLDAGTYSIDLRGVDVVGRSVLIPRAMSVELKDPYVPKQSNTAARKSSAKGPKKKYRNVLSELSEIGLSELPEAFGKLRGLVTATLELPNSSSTGLLSQEIALLIALTLTGGMLLLKRSGKIL